MKKSILKITAIIIFAVVTMVQIKSMVDETKLTELNLANIEALARNESGSGSNCTIIGYEKVWSEGCLYECAKCAEGYYVAIALIECITK